jgi:coenzyme F420-reducing hydrogenase beta subunit
MLASLHIWVEAWSKKRALPGANGSRQWLTPVIPATQEAGIKRIVVRSQPGQIFHETLSQKTLHKKKAGGVAQGEGSEFKPQYCEEERREKEKEKKEEEEEEEEEEREREKKAQRNLARA